MGILQEVLFWWMLIYSVAVVTIKPIRKNHIDYLQKNNQLDEKLKKAKELVMLLERANTLIQSLNKLTLTEEQLKQIDNYFSKKY